jgi:hypothetical protein
MTWNYRIIDHGGWRAIHSVHYDADCRPTHYSSNPTTFCTDADDDPDALREMLEMALADIGRLPVLDVKIFKSPLAGRPVAPRSNPR